MWRRVYLLLVVLRLWFALSPSYLHPDENFQGPEVIAGQIFEYPIRRTWEFTNEFPIRSVFPLWPVYGLPMLLLRWLWIDQDHEVAPITVFWTLRVLMFVISFVLEDWAIHELIQSPSHRRRAVMLVASSYVTWTFQTHTFSNSIETLVVAWCMVLIHRIVDQPKRSSLLSCAILGMVSVFGLFNRITFPAFLLIPGIRLVPYFFQQPSSLIVLSLSVAMTLFVAITLDTSFYSPEPVTWSRLWTHPVITPLNNFRYNSNPENLAQHGLHPWYQHLLVNLPMLLGPASLLVAIRPKPSLRLFSALVGIFVLSVFRHQEARFLLPTVPLILSSVQLPKNRRHAHFFVGAWIVYNAFFGILMGLYHQGGIIPAQVFLSTQADATQAIWWKTYTPPIWLLNGKNEVLTTHDVMGLPEDDLLLKLDALATCHSSTPHYYETQQFLREEREGAYLIAPTSAAWLDQYTTPGEHVSTTSPPSAVTHLSPEAAAAGKRLHFSQVWKTSRHLNLDDMDFAQDGVWATLRRVLGRRGLAIWRVTKDC